ncbi:uncharacterized protein LOC115627864 isoform X2 [Scaptodrosophila lebanonensis]|uniref:Uncharacterized protein LOC115627864 isoform X2 n=1 Tax=Drosophila lebanonensis TaxID=7225 RepID=A0A6J2TXI0_DROLE|nr:uncharacterized protein LOC115627864 isoform X2 [Scaptodrosophila lebanonensis]
MQSPIDRPVSTYDNLLTASSALHTSTPKFKQHQQQPEQEALGEQESKSQFNNNSADQKFAKDDAMTAMVQSPSDLNGTSHSIAAVKAAMNDAKSKFFGINNYEASTAHHLNVSPIDTVEVHKTKPEPKYQNVPQKGKQTLQDNDTGSVLAAENDMQPMKIATATATPTSPQHKSLRYATYEQVPLNDLHAPQPSQAVYMSTTVPQNMKGMKIAGRHTPTRNSLRHSRMIVVNNKSSDTVQDAYAAYTRNVKISRYLLIVQFIIGLLLIVLSLSIFLRAPNASILANPYMSGFALLLASIAGLFLLRRHQKNDYRPQKNCYKMLVVESHICSALALIFCCLLLVCGAIEFAQLRAVESTGGCNSTNPFLGFSHCPCTQEEDQQGLDASLEDDPAMQYQNGAQNNLNGNKQPHDGCGMGPDKWPNVLICSMTLNVLGMFATFLYVTIFIYCRLNRTHFHTSV